MGHKEEWDIICRSVACEINPKTYLRILEKLYDEGFYTVVFVLLELGKSQYDLSIVIENAMFANMIKTWDNGSIGRIVKAVCNAQ